MRSDILADQKCIHVKLKKEIYTALRSDLFQRGLSMQEVFNEFAQLLASHESRAQRIIQDLITKKIEAQLEGKIVRRTRKRGKIAEHDRESLYSLIEGSQHEEGNQGHDST